MKFAKFAIIFVIFLMTLSVVFSANCKSEGNTKKHKIGGRMCLDMKDDIKNGNWKNCVTGTTKTYNECCCDPKKRRRHL